MNKIMYFINGKWSVLQTEAKWTYWWWSNGGELETWNSKDITKSPNWFIERGNAADEKYT